MNQERLTVAQYKSRWIGEHDHPAVRRAELEQKDLLLYLQSTPFGNYVVAFEVVE